MNQDDYIALSERTEKKFPEGFTLQSNHISILNHLVPDLLMVNHALDHMKRHLIYGAELEIRPPQTEFEIRGKFINQQQMELLHAAIGKVTESVEFFEMMAAHVLKDQPLDVANAIEEVGDGMWYDAIVFRNLSSNFERAGQINIGKLTKRFPEKFESEQALNRDLDAEREVLEGGVMLLEMDDSNDNAAQRDTLVN